MIAIDVQILDQLLRLSIVIPILTQPKGPLIDFPHILAHQQLHHIILQHLQLKINLPVIVRENRDPVLKLISIRIRSVVHENHVLQVAVYHPEIFDVHALGGEVAVLSEETMVDPLAIWVEVVYDHVAVACMAGGEEDYLEVFA